MRPVPVTILHGDVEYARALGRALGLTDPSLRVRISEPHRVVRDAPESTGDRVATTILLADEKDKEKLNEYSKQFKHTLWLVDDPLREDRENHCYYKHCGRNSLTAAIHSLTAWFPGEQKGGTPVYGRRIGVAAAAGGVGTTVVALALARSLAMGDGAPVQYVSFEPQPVTDLYFPVQDGENNNGRRTGNDLLYYMARNADPARAAPFFPDCLLRDAWGVTTLRPGYGGSEWASLTTSLGEAALAAAAGLAGAERTVADFSLTRSETSRWLYATCDPLIVVHDGSGPARQKNLRGLEFLEAEISRVPGARLLTVQNKWRPSEQPSGMENELCIEWDTGSFQRKGAGIQINLERGFGIGVERIIAELELDG